MADREYLVVKGRLNQADDFTPRRCGSTCHVRPRARTAESDLRVETLDNKGSTFRTASASERSNKICGPQSETWRVEAIIPLDDHASKLRLIRRDRTIWSTAIPDRPTLFIELVSLPSRARKRPARSGKGTAGLDYPGGKPAVLRVKTSEPAKGFEPYIMIIHKWGMGLFRTVFAGKPAENIEIPADRMPGGSDCQLIAIYSNGLRSEVAATAPFDLARIGPVLMIDSPKQEDGFQAGMSVSLEGFAEDPEDPRAILDQERLSWFMDGVTVATGGRGTILSVPAGRHEVVLNYTGLNGSNASKTVFLDVKESEFAAADDWPEWQYSR